MLVRTLAWILCVCQWHLVPVCYTNGEDNQDGANLYKNMPCLTWPKQSTRNANALNDLDNCTGTMVSKTKHGGRNISQRKHTHVHITSVTQSDICITCTRKGMKTSIRYTKNLLSQGHWLCVLRNNNSRWLPQISRNQIWQGAVCRHTR